MEQYAVITALGQDHPGLVAAISKLILDADCNIEDSRMAVLGGVFAMVILVAGDAEDVTRLFGSLPAAGKGLGLTVTTQLTHSPQEGPPAEAIPYQVTAYSMDHPGIVQQVSHFLSERGINVRALDTHVSSAPVTGQPLFTLSAVIDVPASENVRELRRGLEDIGAVENIDIDVKPAT